MMPIEPPAPVTASTTTDWPSEACMGSARMRHKVSSGPPAENGRMTVTGLDGKACAFADAGQPMAGMLAILRRARRRIVASTKADDHRATQRGEHWHWRARLARIGL